MAAASLQLGAQDLTHYKKIVKELSSAKYQGRGYAEDGANKAGRWIAGKFEQIGADEVICQPFKLEEWDVDWKENTHYSLGLFLVQYLGNGFNLADAAHLTYNDHYFQSGKKSFHFVRQKTEDRSDMEVVIPIIPPLQTILDQIAAPPIKGSLVFPGIYGDAQTPIEKRKRVAMENQNIKKRVRRLVKSMGWEVQPSCTWCRHSFATNLTHAGVPHNYISESMGHSVDSNITNRYIDAFPLAQQMEFNSRLLKLNDDADIMEELKGLTSEQIKALIALVKNVNCEYGVFAFCA